MLENTLESPLDNKEIQPVNLQVNQSWIFIGKTDTDTEAPILWPPDGEKWFTGKYPNAGKDWSWEEKGMTYNEMIVWHLWLDRHEFEQALGVGDGQGSLVCSSSKGCKSRTQLSNWTDAAAERFQFLQWRFNSGSRLYDLWGAVKMRPTLKKSGACSLKVKRKRCKRKHV